MSSRAKTVLVYVVFLISTLPVGTLWHEVIGHGLTGVLYGGRITFVKVMGVQLYPQLAWLGSPDGFHYGRCSVEGVTTATGRYVRNLGGSVSTWCVAVGATVLLWTRRWRGWKRAALVCLSIWWIDILAYTLPTLGIRHSVFFGGMYSEPYEAATALGCPGPLFQRLVMMTSVLLALALAMRLLRDSGLSRAHRAPDTLGE